MPLPGRAGRLALFWGTCGLTGTLYAEHAPRNPGDAMQKKKTPFPPLPEDEGIFVTRSPLPPQADYARCLEQIFATRRLTNHQTFVRQLEHSLRRFLNTPHLSLCVNGTAGLQLALHLAALPAKR